MIKRAISLLMSIVMVLSMLPLQALAAEIPEEDSTVPVETLAITEETEMPETSAPEEIPETTAPETTCADWEEPVEEVSQEPFFAEASDFTYTVLNGTYCEISGYTGTDAELTIPDVLGGYIVQSIGNNAFKNNKTLTAVALPESIETMGTGVFYGCSALTDVRLNENLKTIGNDTFRNCTALESITVPAAVTSIGRYAFAGCTALTEVNLSEGLTTIYSYAFENCTSLEEIRLPDSVASLGARAFYNCTKLSEVNFPLSWTRVLNSYNNGTGTADSDSDYQSPFQGCTSLKQMEIPEGVTAIPKHAFRNAKVEEVTLPESLTAIGNYAFDCSSLKRIILPDSVTTLGNYALASCESLTELDLSENLATVGSYAFAYSSALTEITIPDGVTSLGEYAFRDCDGLKKVTVGTGVTKLSRHTFYGCSGLTEVTLPDTLTTIYSYAFENCTSLETIHIPDSVTDLGARAFYNCTKLSEVNFPASWTRVLNSYNNGTGTADSDSDYQSPFQGCTALTKIEVPEGVTAIPKHAFRNAKVEEVTLPESLSAIGNYAFDCSSLKSITLPDSVTSLGNYALASCEGLKTVSLSENLTTVGSYAFAYSSGLTEVTIPDSLTSLGEYAFRDCDGLKKVTVGAGVTKLSRHTFYGCSGLTEVTLPDTLTTIYSYAFENCTSLEEIHIPDSVTELGARAFYNCTRLSEVNFPTSWTKVLNSYNNGTGTADSDSDYQSPFQGCTALKQMEIPEGVTTVPKHAFRSCTGLEEVVLADTVTTIQVYAFSGCTKLEKIWLGQTVTTIGNKAFENCSALTIHGVEGSYAQTYAESNNIPFSTELMVYPTSSIEGKVQTAGGAGVAGVTVTLYDLTWNEELDTLITDASGSWNCADVIIGHKYRITFYHPDYALTNSVQNYTITEAAITAQTVIASAKESIPETSAEDFAYTVLNGTYCQITGYTGEETAIRIPAEINGYIVQSIGNNAFKNNKTLTAVALPESIETMGTGVFYGCSALTDVRLNENLKTIGNDTFRNCTALESITVPAAVTSIGRYAFAGCTALTEVNLSEGLTTIYSYAFENCTSLEEIRLPDSVASLGARAFYNCTKLSEVNFPLSWTRVLNSYNNGTGTADSDSDYQSPFQGCTALTKIEVPEGVTAIPKHAFRNAKVEEVTLPESLTAIGNYAFDCSSLKSITLPDSVTSLGNYALASCEGLKTVSLSENLTTVGSYAFAYSSSLTEVTIPDSLTSLGEYAFRDCDGLKKVTVGTGVTKLSRHTFYGCTGLTEVTLPDTLTTIYSYAFENCTSLETIHIPDSVTDLGARAFYNCTKLSEVNFPASWTRVLNSYNNGTGTADSDSDYQSPFQGCTALKQMEIPEGVTAIPKHAFRNAKVEEVTLPESLTAIGNYAFDCSSLKSITLPDSVTTLGNYALASCESLKTVSLSANLTTVGSYAFAYSSGLTEVTIPDSLTSLGEYAFRDCDGLKKVTVGTGVTKLSRFTFYGCSGLTEVNLSDSLTTIYSYAFENCTSLEEIHIPDSVTELGARAFYNCTRLSEVNFPTSWTTVLNAYNNGTSYSDGNSDYQSPFQGCTALKQMEIPEGVTTVPKHAFRSCTGLEEVVLADTVTTIQVYAFSGCTKLEKIWLAETVTTIGNKAFENCSALTIHGVEGSYAQTYAESNHIPFSTELMVYPTSSISGNVKDENGIGIAGVTVTLYDLTWNEELDTLITDASGSWNCADVIIGHKYRITFYHPDYALTNSVQNYTITEAAITAQTVIASAKESIPETSAEDFAYTVLNGTYCQITGYTGEETAIRIPAEINGYIVQSIGNNAFKNNKTLTAVALPESIETMGTGVFYGCSALTDVRLNENLKTIGNDTFRNCTALESITVPAAVTSIGRYAFAGCTALTEVNLSEGLTTIYSYAFENCTSLEEIRLPDSVASLGARAFYNCTNLSEVNFPASWTRVLNSYNNGTGTADSDSDYQSPFQGCTSLKQMEIPEGVTAIPKHAFRNAKVEEVTLPESLTAIGNYAFDCSSLKSITLPDSVTTLGNYALASCEGLKTVSLSENLATVGSYAFAYSSALTEITIPDSLTSLGEYAFRDCDGLKKVTVGTGVTKLSRHTFYGCTGLTEVTLPETLTTIYSYAFENCTSLETIHIPDSVTDLGARAFYNCTKLSEVNFPASWTRVLNSYNNGTGTADSDSDYQSPFQGCTALKQMEIPEGVTAIPKHAFRNAKVEEVTLPESLTAMGNYAFDCSSLKSITLPDSVTTLGNYALASCEGLKTVSLSENLTTVGNYAFAYSSGLTEVTIPDSLTSLGEYAFRDCDGLKKVTVGTGVTKLSRFTFYGCTGLTEVTLPETLTTIYSYAFENCTSLEEIHIPDSVTELGARAFYNCTRLSEVNFPTSWTTVLNAYNNGTSYSDGNSDYQSPFQGCTALKQMEIPEGVTTIPKHAFRSCTGLEEVTFPSTLKTIGVYAFEGCTNLRIVEFNEGLTAIPDYAFRNCTRLAVLEIPSTVTTIGRDAFRNCTGLRIVELGSGVTTIGEAAFYGCDGLVSLVLNDGLTTIGGNAFADCENLQTVEIPASVESIQNNSFNACDKLTVYCYSGTQAHMVGEAAGLDLFILDAHDHEFDTQVETLPECTRDGSQILTCSICGYYYIEILEAPGHVEGGWIALNKPSCTEEGIRVQTCFVCEAEVARDYIPAYGHRTGDWVVTEGSCVEGGHKAKICNICSAEVERESIPANGHSWGEWIVESMPSVLCQGVTYRTCAVCQEREEIIQEKLEIDYTTNRDYGLAHLTVVNATTLAPVSGASVHVITENDGEAILRTDSNGCVSQVLPVGKVQLSVMANGYQMRNLAITVVPGENEIPQIGISNGSLVDGQLTSREMTYEEMIAAGIDVNDPSNQHLFKYALVLEFVPGIDWLSLSYYFDKDGIPHILDWSVEPPPHTPPPEPDPDSNRRPGHWVPIWPNDWDTPAESDRHPSALKYVTPGEETITVYPISERFYLVIYGEVHWLKEMYDVELIAINNSMTDTVENLEATLTLPEGLSLAKMVGEQQTLTQQMGTLDHGESKSVHWYVRGDEEGTYSIAATLRGNMLPFGDAFEKTFEAKDPITVLAGSAMHLTFHVQDSAFYGQPYKVLIDLENVSDKTLYNVTHAITDIEQYRVTEYSNGMTEIEEYPVVGGTGSIFVPEFRPGDKIVIEVTTTIMFQSKLIEYQKNQLAGFVTGVKNLVDAMNAVQTGLDMVESVTAVVSGSMIALDSLTYLHDASTSNAAVAAQAKLLQTELSALEEDCGGNLSTDTMRTMSELKSSGILDQLEDISENPDALSGYSAKDLEELTGKVKSARTTAAMARSSGRTYDAYEAMMAIIDLIPVRFSLVDGWLVTLEGSTTEIPYTIVVNPVGPQYFGIENLSRLLLDTVIMAVGEYVEVPWYLEIFTGDFKENMGYYDAAERVAAQLNNAYAFKTTGTGGSTFRAWVEPAASLSSGRTGIPDFTLDIDNGTGVLGEDGVLTFSGSGILTATPNSMVPGVLCVEMQDGTVKRYTIDVVEEHACSAQDWTVLNAPAEGMDGLRVKYCDACHDMIEVDTMTVCAAHEFGEAVTVLEPTADMAGKKIRTCSHCGAEEYEYIEPLGLSQYVFLEAQNTQLVAGKSTELTAQILPIEAADAVLTWTLAEGDQAYATLKANGAAATVTAKKVSQRQTVTVIVTADDESISEGRIELTILPMAEAVRIFRNAADVTGREISFDLNGDTLELALTALADPADAMQEFQWSSANQKIATVENGTVTFTGTSGKVKITATATDGSKKTASVTIDAQHIPHNVQKEDEVEGEADIAILGGKSRNLVVYDRDTGKALTAKQITWSMDEQYAAFASVDAKGKLKTQKTMTLARIVVKGTILGSSDDPVVYVIDVYPAVTHVEITESQQIANGKTLNMKGETMTLQVSTYPSDAMTGVTWSNPDAKKQAYAAYTENEDGSLTIHSPTGKAGTLTLKATSNDGSKKSATVKIQFGILTETLEIQEPPILSVRSGESITFTTVSTPEKVSKAGVVWSLADSADSVYVTVSNGKVKAKNVTENHWVTILATSKDGNASDSITILVLPKAEETLALKSGEAYLTGRTVAMDSAEASSMELSAWLLINPIFAQFGEEPQTVTWTSSKPEIASVSSDTGETVTVTLHKSGNATITAKDAEGRKATVTIKGSVLVDDLRIDVKETENRTDRGIEVASGKTVTLLAVTNSDAANKKAIWSITEGAEFATITNTGKLTAKKDLTASGIVKVKATAADGSGVTAEVSVTVRPVAQGLMVYTMHRDTRTFSVRSDEIWWARNNTTAQWDLTTQGDIVTIGADVYPFYPNREDMSAMQTVSWKSSAPKVADFVRAEDGSLVTDDAGNVQLLCKGTGNMTITATAADGSKQKVSFKLSIVKHVEDFEMAPQILASGKSLALNKVMTIYPSGTTTKKFSWAITGGDGAAFATISSTGTLKAKNVTEKKTVAVTVTALDALGHSETFSVDLYPATTKVQLYNGAEEVTGKTLTLAAGDSLQLQARCQPETAAGRYTWSSSKAASVEVDENGCVTIIGGTGTVTITCAAADGSGKKATVKIKIG